MILLCFNANAQDLIGCKKIKVDFNEKSCFRTVKDTISLLFMQNYELDTFKIYLNDVLYDELYLTTNQSTGDCEDFSFLINPNRNTIIKLKEMSSNQCFEFELNRKFTNYYISFFREENDISITGTNKHWELE